MGFPWKKLGQVGLGIAGPTIGVDLSSLLNKTKAKRHAYPDDPDRGHDYVAIAIREALEKAFPAAKEALDRIAVVWATVALQEQQEAEEKPAPRRKRRKRTTRKKAKK